MGVLVDHVEFVPAGAQPLASPYPEEISTDLGPGLRLQAPLAHPAGTTLSLAWSEAGQAPRIRLLRSPGGTVIREFTVAPGDTLFTAAMPPDVPGGSWLEIFGGQGTLTAAALERERWPLDVVLIVVDTLRPDYLGCYGGEPTPGVDGLAADGILFEQAFCQVPITGPSHTSLFTSRLPSETGVLNNARGTIPTAMPTFAEILVESGWQARAAVAIGNIRRGYGFDRGFADYDDTMDGGWIVNADAVGPRIEAQRRDLPRPGLLFAHYADPHEPYDAHGRVERTAELLVDGEVRAVFPTSTYTPTRLALDLPTGETSITIRSGDAFHIRSLALRRHTAEAEMDAAYDGFASFTEYSSTIHCRRAGRADLVVHVADMIDGLPEMRARYALEVAHADRWVGVLLDSLRAADRYDESLIIFTADHGESLGEHGQLGHVENLHDPMIRVPLVIKPPLSWGRGGGGRREDLAALVDVLPTMLAAVGMPPLPGARGRDLLAKGAADRDVFVFAETHRPEAQRDLYGVRTATGKVVFDPSGDVWEYYDLAADPAETVDAARPGDPEFERHRNLLLAVLKELDPAAVQGHGDVVVDERTAEMLKSLGY